MGNLHNSSGTRPNGNTSAPAQRPILPPSKKKEVNRTIKIVNAISYRCGHTISAAFFKGKECPNCFKKALQDRTNRRLTKDLARNGRRDVERLPDGSRFENLIYDSSAVEWSGSLLIPIEGGAYKTFSEKSGSVFKLLELLDIRYREWLETKKEVAK